MRFVVLRFAPDPAAAGTPPPFLDLAPPWPLTPATSKPATSTPDDDPPPASAHGVAPAADAPASSHGGDPVAEVRASSHGVDAAAGARDRTADDLLSDALERDLTSVRTLRDDLATLAAVLGVTTVLDEALGSPDVATTIRSRAEGLSLTDGAATTADGPLVGLHVLDAPDLDALVDVLTLLPAGTFEVHPVVAA